MHFMAAFFTLMVMVFMPASAQAAPDKYDLDKAHTQILFFVNHLGFSTSQGEFHKYDGNILFDQVNPENSTVDITIHTASIDMDHEKWNAHLRNEDFFDVEKFPFMTFKSTGFGAITDNTGGMTGDLTLLGITRPVTLFVTHNKSARHPFNGKYVSGFSAKTTIKRSDFGMTYGLPLVGDDIEIMIEVEAVREDGEGQEAVNP